MGKTLKTRLIRLSQKKLSEFDKYELYYTLLRLPYHDTTFVKLFLDNYYKVDTLPSEFYKMFVYNVHSGRYEKMFKIVLNKNIYDLINFLKGEDTKADSLDIAPNSYFNLPNKQIKSIINLLKKLEIKNDKLPIKKGILKNPNWQLKREGTNSESELLEIAIKMYLSIGLDNSIELLSGKYGCVDYEIIYYMFSKLNVKEDNIIFNEFLFGNKKDPNNNMKLMLEGKLDELFINFDYFYNSIDYFIEKLGSKLNKSKVLLLLKERYLAPKVENPELTGDILDDMISSYYNKFGITDSEKDIINKNMKAYNEKLKTKTKSSIMKVDIPKIDGYIFEMTPLSDVRNLVMGYRAGNCFRLNGDAFILFNKFLTNPHMRLLSISTLEYKDFGMVLLMRNGNTLIAQGIETSKRVPNEVCGKKLYDAVKEAIKYIMDEMNKEDDIVATIIGLSNSNTYPYNSNVLPFIVNPLLENNHQFYNGISNYQGLLDLKKDKNIKDIKLFTPEKFYSDINTKIYVRDKNDYPGSPNYRDVEKILISHRFLRFQKENRYDMMNYYYNLTTKDELYAICTLDWSIVVFEDGGIQSFINSSNPKVIDQFENELEKVKNNIDSFDIKTKKIKRI